MARTVAGLKIRESRRALGLRQNELARRVGISASYLNLIERDQRSIGGSLLAAIGRELGLSVDELDGSSERRLRDQLATLAEDPALGAEELRDGSADALIARYPGLGPRRGARLRRLTAPPRPRPRRSPTGSRTTRCSPSPCTRC